ncbi:polysaccharide biosynthesis protein [Deinococcus pimensis]|uniref:polysaccharide biosynthesis protein n=1 Tax=Deinococcus pimensis TaxID=309888 RepID=UPI0004B16C1F|nr:nucleoside-diphosphate sugar epimerase/dehydratase [Deinococcus pimensis]
MNTLKYVCDLVLWTSALLLATFLGQEPQAAWLTPPTIVFLAVGFTLKLLIEWFGRLYLQHWGRISVRDLYALARAVGFGALALLSSAFVLQPLVVVSPAVPLLDAVLSLVLLGGVRLATRIIYERHKRSVYQGTARRVLLVGAGEAGSLIAREMARHPEAGLRAVGFLDDRQDRQRQIVVGLPVLGPVKDLVRVAREVEAQEVLIAVPSASGAFVRQVVELARSAQLRYRIIPGVFEILSGQVSISQIRDVDVQDLLRREPVQLNNEEISDYIRDRRVLVTGAGGSIGSEIVRQVARYSPSRIVLLGRGENSIFSIQHELAREWPEIEQVALIGDVRDAPRLDAVFAEQRPDVVFHAAAHKHVPLMEVSPTEAVLNNIVGTANVTQMCLRYHVRRFVNISTDKAVNPTSVMGASKRLAEMVISGAARQTSQDQAFVSVRFGNVLGSRGSVIPTFMEQIRAGGPVTVTHPEMRRYFMTIPEAARLVLQAGGLGENGRVYLLNMGEPVKIVDLAQDVIRLSGAQNIDVVYTGTRPGEKLYEELLTTSEGVDSTTHSEIFSARLQSIEPVWIGQQVEDLRRMALSNDTEAIRRRLALIIPENKFGLQN